MVATLDNLSDPVIGLLLNHFFGKHGLAHFAQVRVRKYEEGDVFDSVNLYLRVQVVCVVCTQ